MKEKIIELLEGLDESTLHKIYYVILTFVKGK